MAWQKTNGNTVGIGIPDKFGFQMGESCQVKGMFIIQAMILTQDTLARFLNGLSKNF